MRDVVRALLSHLETGRPQVLCQVVETKGSTPQKAGALMLVDPSGVQAGTLGGGCVENEVKQKALKQFQATDASLYSFVLDHDYAWADGLICGGKMVMLTTGLNRPAALPYYRTLLTLLDAGQGFSEAVVVDPDRQPAWPLGQRFLFGPDGSCRASLPETVAPDLPAPRYQDGADRPRPRMIDGVAWIPSPPRIRLVIVGAGHVGQAVAQLAVQADFDVWVVDDRAIYLSEDRFPTAQKRLAGPIEETLKQLEITPSTYALIVTRGHGHDQEALYHLAETPAPYVGLIGSKRKIRLIFESLRDAGISQKALARVATPVGFDIGSQTVPEIAISIVAELIARRNRGPQGLAHRPGVASEAL